MSEKLKLNKEDMSKVGKGLVIAMSGAGLTYLVSIIGNVDFGGAELVVGAGFSVLVNFCRKFLFTQKQGLPGEFDEDDYEFDDGETVVELK